MQDQLTLINRISDELNTDLDPDKMLRRVLRLTVSHLGATTGSIMLFDADDRVAAYILQEEVSDARAHRIVGTVLTEGFAGWVLKHGEGDFISNTMEDERWVVYKDQTYNVLSAIATPLKRRQRILGLITLVHEEANKFDQNTLLLLNAIAGQAAIALENARLYRETEQERSTLSAIINSTQDAVLVTTPENKVLLLNPASQEMMGLNGQQWQDTEITDLTENNDLLKLFNPESPAKMEIKLPDGRTMWASITEIPQMGQVTVLRDVSPYKELDKMKRDFVTAFTHDLRTPLATVKGYIELVRMDGPVTERQEEDLVGITRAANLMKALVEDLLELSRLERLEELTVEKLAMYDVVEAALDAIKPLAKTKEIDIVLDESPDTLYIEGNAVLLARAVGNYLDNAIKYTPIGGKVFANIGQKENRALISVTDTGPGIREKDLPRVFEKFFRARPELDDVPGTGLGLSIVKTIAAQHHGEVWVESVPNEGSTFTLALPLVEG